MLMAWVLLSLVVALMVWWSGWECGLRRAKSEYWKGYADRDQQHEPSEVYK
jgi:hypothetical protein